MAVNVPHKRRWRYTDDHGTNYQVSAESDLVSQGNQGGSAADGTELPLPHGFKMRRVYVSNGTITRSVPVYALDAAFWTGTNNTILLNLASVQTTFTQTKNSISERPNRRRVTNHTA